MPKNQPLDKCPQQQHLDAYGGTEAGTFRSTSQVLKRQHPQQSPASE
jgi:hypothetical protein